MLTETTKILRIINDIREEVIRAEEIHKPINSLHEGYAVIAEELDEFWDQVKLKTHERDLMEIRSELIQTAAMCVRTILDVLPHEET